MKTANIVVADGELAFRGTVLCKYKGQTVHATREGDLITHESLADVGKALNALGFTHYTLTSQCASFEAFETRQPRELVQLDARWHLVTLTDTMGGELNFSHVLRVAVWADHPSEALRHAKRHFFSAYKTMPRHAGEVSSGRVDIVGASVAILIDDFCPEAWPANSIKRINHHLISLAERSNQHGARAFWKVDCAV